jgi:hypothetical protein
MIISGILNKGLSLFRMLAVLVMDGFIKKTETMEVSVLRLKYRVLMNKMQKTMWRIHCQ